jgi:3,4-dihydroxy 2-butanone 4-phosphate synthase/GTP cyclohydrolase II
MSAIQRVKKAIEEIKKGNMVIMLDDEDRENEGDLVYCATLSDDQKVNFMATEARGLICVSVSKDTANRLDLNPMVPNNTSSYETAFTVSVDATDALTGISAGERDDTIQILANPLSKTTELVRPGHIFPLIAKDGGVLERTGHTEGSVDLCRLSGFHGEAVICEIMKKDGTMARRDDLDIFAKEHNLKMVYISDIIEYRLAHEKLVEEISSNEIEFMGKKAIKKEFKDHQGLIHTTISYGEISKSANIKFHNIESDLDLLINDRLDILTTAIEYIQQNSGVIVFLSSNKLDDKNSKDFGIGAQILNILGITNMNLLTSNKKNHFFIGLNGFGLTIDDEIVL